MAYINAASVQAIRNELKKKYKGALKFSVTKDHHSGVRVVILQGTVDFSDQVRDTDKINFSVNQYYLENYGQHAKLLGEIYEIVKTAPATVGERAWYDNSDSMIDFFDTAYYISIEVGRWDRPYAVLK